MCFFSCQMPVKKRFLRLEVHNREGFTLELLCNICKYAEENFKELHGIRPLQRVEAGFGMPKKAGDRETFFKAVLCGGNPKWRNYANAPIPCRWNLWIPDDWEAELPKHKMYRSGIVQDECTGFAYSRSRIQSTKEGVQVIYLNCGLMDNQKKRQALERVLADMGLYKKSTGSPRSCPGQRVRRRAKASCTAQSAPARTCSGCA